MILNVHKNDLDIQGMPIDCKFEQSNLYVLYVYKTNSLKRQEGSVLTHIAWEIGRVCQIKGKVHKHKNLVITEHSKHISITHSHASVQILLK